LVLYMEVQPMSITIAPDRVVLERAKAHQQSALYPKPEGMGVTAQFL